MTGENNLSCGHFFRENSELRPFSVHFSEFVSIFRKKTELSGRFGENSVSQPSSEKVRVERQFSIKIPIWGLLFRENFMSWTFSVKILSCCHLQ